MKKNYFLFIFATVLFVLFFVSELTAADYTFVKTWCKKRTGKGEFVNLHGIIVDDNSYVYAADTANNRIQKFKP